MENLAQSDRDLVGAVRFAFTLVLVACLACGFLGCAAKTTHNYKALVANKTVVSELRYLESLKMPSISLREVTLGRACMIMTVFSEDPTIFQTGALIETDRPEFGGILVTLSLENTNLAEYYDALCLAVGGVWWVRDRQVYLRENNPPKNASVSALDMKDHFDPRQAL